jgi:ferredoxin-NADP reductase
MNNEFKARIEKIVSCSDTVKIFRLKFSDDNFSFLPGQFVMMSIPGFVDDNKNPIKRAYSIASSPLENGVLELCISLNPEGRLTPRLFMAKIGDELTISGPFGKFVLESPVNPGIIFIAGGTGIAATISMLRFTYANTKTENLLLFYSVKNPGSFPYKEELLDFQKQGLKLVISTSHPDQKWEFETGRITVTFPKYAREIEKDTQFYLCGSRAMVEDVIIMLEHEGFKKENVHKEEW